MRLLPLILFCAAVLIGQSAQAQWRTTQIAPVPPGAIDTESDDEALGFDVQLLITDRDDLIAGAPNFMNAFIPVVEGDLAKLQSAGYPEPLSAPLLDDVGSGNSYFPLVWKAISAPMGQRCELKNNSLLGTQTVQSQSEVNKDTFRFSRLEEAQLEGDPRRRNAQDIMSTLTIHEMMHSIQYRAWTPNCEESGLEKWLYEGTADAVAYYLLTKRRSNALDTYTPGRSKRNWSLPIDTVSEDDSITYTTASFYRYVMEASEGGHKGGGLAFIKDILSTPVAKLAADTITELDRIVTSYAGTDLNNNPRTLYNVLPEFLTEYASYGGSRYKTYDPVPGISQPLTPMIWTHDVFDGCERANIDHSSTFSKVARVPITVKRLAGECVKVTWANVKQPVTLQIFAKNIPNHHGDLHVGEAVRNDAVWKHNCWDVVNKTNRIQDIALAKCMLDRATPLIGSSKTPDTKVGLWNLDVPIEGNGEVYLVISNVAATPSQSKDHTFELLIGSLAVDYKLAAIVPRAPAGTPPVEKGLANLDARLHVFSGNDQRTLFEGRVIDGPGPGFSLPSGVMGDGSAQGLLSFVRGQNYMVGVTNTGGDAQNPKDAAFIFKDPAGIELNLATPGGIGIPGMSAVMATTPMTGGTIADIGKGAQCGRSFTPDIRIEAVTEEFLEFEVEGDLFDMSRAMSSGAGSGCAAIAAAFVERPGFTVTLPFGPLYDGSSTIVEQNPPGQASYDGNFPKGPAYGGIESARTYLGAGPSGGGGTGGSGSGGPTALTGGGSAGPGPSAAPDPSSNNVGEVCDCTCPRPATATAVCETQCKPIWAACPAPGIDPPERLADRFDRLLSNHSLSPTQRAVLAEDFQALSPETRDYLLNRGN